VSLAAVVGLSSVVAHGIFPGISVPQLILLTFGAVAAIGVALGVALVCSLQFRQFILRHGGIDTQWLWFRSDPPGLERQRNKGKP
jgi:hypothetical protein